jgi:hypothetical protein
MTEKKWNFIGRNESCGIGCDEYVCYETNECKQIWDDGYTEIFEIGG